MLENCWDAVCQQTVWSTSGTRKLGNGHIHAKTSVVRIAHVNVRRNTRSWYHQRFLKHDTVCFKMDRVTNWKKQFVSATIFLLVANTNMVCICLHSCFRFVTCISHRWRPLLLPNCVDSGKERRRWFCWFGPVHLLRCFATLMDKKIETVYNVFDAKLLVANNCSMLIRMDDIFGRWI